MEGESVEPQARILSTSPRLLCPQAGDELGPAMAHLYHLRNVPLSPFSDSPALQFTLTGVVICEKVCRYSGVQHDREPARMRAPEMA